MLDSSDIKEINTIITGHGDVLNDSMLESALSSYHYYETTEEQICSIWRGLIKNHAFRDGNKRTALVCLSIMCDMSNIPLALSNDEAFKYTLYVANSRMDVEDIAKIIFPLKESNMSLSSILKRLVEDAEPISDFSQEPEFDFGHVPKAEAPPTEETPAVEEVPEEEEAPVEEETPVEEPAVKTTRILSMDKRKANIDLKELSALPSPAIPLSKIKEVLGNYKLAFKDTEIKFLGRSGNKDFAVVNDKGVEVANTQLVIYWNRDSETSFTINVYLS